jgi:hypothetical protein
MMGGAVMSEMTHEEALRRADALAGQELTEAEARCAVLGLYINECDSKGSRTAGWSDALRELRALQERRAGLMRRRSLIRQALECPVGERPGKAPLQPPRDPAQLRTQRQIQIRARRHS